MFHHFFKTFLSDFVPKPLICARKRKSRMSLDLNFFAGKRYTVPVLLAQCILFEPSLIIENNSHFSS
jgi:hypothetical protein